MNSYKVLRLTGEDIEFEEHLNRIQKMTLIESSLLQSIIYLLYTFTVLNSTFEYWKKISLNIVKELKNTNRMLYEGSLMDI